MGKEKDITEKVLEDYNDVFADILNVVLFDGKEVVKEEELENAFPVSQMKLTDGLHEQERDTAKFWKHSAFVVAEFGLENQTREDKTMPLRVIGYDGAAYKEEANKYIYQRRKGLPVSPFYPVITVVLSFSRTRWNGPRSLRECFTNVPEELKGLIADYTVRVVDVAYLRPEQLRQLRSDFRFIADYLVQMRATGTYQPMAGQIEHVDETLKLFAAVTGDDRFPAAMQKFSEDGKEQVTMDNIIDFYINKGREEGLNKGREEGLNKGREEGLNKGREEGLNKGREETRREYEALLADKDRAMADKDRVMAEMARELAELRRRYGIA